MEVQASTGSDGQSRIWLDRVETLILYGDPINPIDDPWIVRCGTEAERARERRWSESATAAHHPPAFGREKKKKKKNIEYGDMTVSNILYVRIGTRTAIYVEGTLQIITRPCSI